MSDIKTLGDSIAADTAALACMADRAEAERDYEAAAGFRRAAGFLCDALAIVRDDETPNRAIIAWRRRKAAELERRANRLHQRGYELEEEAESVKAGESDAACPAYGTLLLGCLNTLKKVDADA